MVQGLSMIVRMRGKINNVHACKDQHRLEPLLPHGYQKISHERRPHRPHQEQRHRRHMAVIGYILAAHYIEPEDQVGCKACEVTGEGGLAVEFMVVSISGAKLNKFPSSHQKSVHPFIPSLGNRSYAGAKCQSPLR